MKLGFFSPPRGVADITSCIDYSKKYDFKYIEAYSGSKEFNGQLPFEAWVENAKKLKAHADENGMKFSCFSSGACLVGEQREYFIDHLKKCAVICEILESPYLHHTLYPVKAYTAQMEIITNEKFNEAVSGAQIVSDFAADHGVMTVYEDQGIWLNGVEHFERFLNAMNRDIGVVADLGNIYFVDEEPESFVGRFMPYIKHVHLKDYLKKPGNGQNPGPGWHVTRDGNYLRDVMIGHGVVEFQKIFTMLLRANYDGAFSFESFSLESYHPDFYDMNVANVRRFWENAKREIGK